MRPAPGICSFSSGYIPPLHNLNKEIPSRVRGLCTGEGEVRYKCEFEGIMR